MHCSSEPPTIFSYDKLISFLAGLGQRPNADKSGMVLILFGPSGIGKSQVSIDVIAHLEQNSVRGVLVAQDSFLKHEFRGVHCYRVRTEEPLGPQHYDWDQMRRFIDKLRAGEGGELDIYEHNIGWCGRRKIVPGRIIILEGLFANRWVRAGDQQCVIIALEAPPTLLKRFRLNREKGFRTIAESRREWISVLRSWARYIRPDVAQAHIHITFINEKKQSLIRKLRAFPT